MTVITFTVHGNPAPQGSKSFMGVKDGKGVMVESSAKTLVPWRQAVIAAARIARIGRIVGPLDGPLVAAMTFTLRKPLSAPKRKQLYPMVKPDISKLARSTEDALVIAGLIRDDARIVGYTRLWKVYPGEGVHALDSLGAIISIMTMDEYLKGVVQ